MYHAQRHAIGTILAIAAVAALAGCQTTHLSADGGLSVWSVGDVKVAACPGAEHAWEASDLEAVTDVGVVAPDALPGCVVIHEGGLSEIAGNTLDALFSAALAVIGRTLP